jgi:prefoldin subunit 5
MEMTMSLFGPKTVDSAIASLVKAIADLETVEFERSAAAQKKESEIERLRSEADQDRTELKRAQAVRNRLLDLIEEE